MTSSLRNTDFRSLLNQVDQTVLAESETKKKKSGGQNALSSKDRHKQRYLQILRRQKQKEATESTTVSHPESLTRPVRDRAEERRKQTGNYLEVTKEYKELQDRSIEESKFLGGDIEHTHLVKGLDYVLLSKIRSEIGKKEAEKQCGITLSSSTATVPKTSLSNHNKQASTLWMKRMVSYLVQDFHPHHISYQQKLEKIDAVIFRGAQFKGNTQHFYPGRLLYQFSMNNDPNQCNDDVPILISQYADSRTITHPAGVIVPLHSTILSELSKTLNNFSRKKGKDSSYTSRIIPLIHHPNSNLMTKDIISKSQSDTAITNATEISDDEDIFDNVGRFNAEDINIADLPVSVDSAHNDSGPRVSYFNDEQDLPESAINPCTSTTTTTTFPRDRMKDTMNDDETLTDAPKRLEMKSSRDRTDICDNEYSECYPDMGGLEEGWDGSDDEVLKGAKVKKRGIPDEISMGEKKKPKFTARAARRQAEREWKQVEGYIESNKYRNLDALETHIDSEAHSRPPARFPTIH